MQCYVHPCERSLQKPIDWWERSLKIQHVLKWDPNTGRRQTYVELAQRRPVASVKAGIVQLDEFLPDLLPVRPFISHGLGWSCRPEARGKGVQSKCKQWMLKGRSKNVNTNTKIGMSYQNSPCHKHLLIYSNKTSCLWTTILEVSIMIYMCK